LSFPIHLVEIQSKTKISFGWFSSYRCLCRCSIDSV